MNRKCTTSTAVHLEKAISNAETKQDKARWEYLLGQLYEMSGQFDKASGHYNSAAKHTVDPIMDIYSRLNDAKLLRKAEISGASKRDRQTPQNALGRINI